MNDLFRALGRDVEALVSSIGRGILKGGQPMIFRKEEEKKEKRKGKGRQLHKRIFFFIKSKRKKIIKHFVETIKKI